MEFFRTAISLFAFNNRCGKRMNEFFSYSIRSKISKYWPKLTERLLRKVDVMKEIEKKKLAKTR